MKGIRYSEIRRLLRKVYFTPERGAQERLLKKLGVPYGGDTIERRFVLGFRITAAAIAALICLLNIGSIRPGYLNRYQIDSVIEISRSIDFSDMYRSILRMHED